MVKRRGKIDQISFSPILTIYLHGRRREKWNGKVERKSRWETRGVKNFLIESRAKKIFETVGDGGKVSIMLVLFPDFWFESRPKHQLARLENLKHMHMANILLGN